ncbi:hypothetical protein B0F90DRAFT_1309737 [Multifurca ochricompacta]|uniref:Arrestin-like N-terminal domain-containing protein n=1 Tax=Multifurca ochricompacta TaxID=376703 RepID=A0AAD4M786_9AGAM|nr:hypothetical protein B0F90DRAFT_1309737 [Multifurca ochricompacta]
MDIDNAPPLAHNSNSKRHARRETPFYQLQPKLDPSLSPSLTSLRSQASLPYFTSPSHSQHRYRLGSEEGNNRPWLSLLISSRSPKPEFLPVFIGKDVVAGIVELDLMKPESIREVKITLQGETTQLSQKPHVFLELSQTLITQPSGKLSGKSSHPFSFILPGDVTIDESNWAMVYPVPPKFHEKGILYIDYKIVVTVRRRLLSVDNTSVLASPVDPLHASISCSLTSNLVYIPETTAEHPSILRQRAYFNKSPLDPPILDPGGWKLLPPVEAVGTLVPNVTVIAHLSIANPLTFALGTPIPLFLELRSSGAAHLDPELIDVRLVRTVITRGVAGGIRSLDLARAVFWPAPGCSQSTKLWGEVIVGRRLTPSFNFSKCSVRYSIVLYPHSPEQIECQPLISEEVSLTLRNASGVVPRRQAPPGVTPPQIERQRAMPPRFFSLDFGIVRT